MRNVTPVDRIGDIEIRNGMVFYTSTVAGVVEPKCLRLSDWEDMELRFNEALRAYRNNGGNVLFMEAERRRKEG